MITPMRLRRASRRGTADVNGELWGARAEAWAEVEPQSAPIFQEVIRRAGIGAGTYVLDVGCGSGSLCRMAADLGAKVFGLDASEALIQVARTRVPEADFRVGDLEFPPYEDESFHAVTGVNSFQFAADAVAALREAGRVAKRGGRVVAAVWGRPERVELLVPMRALHDLLPSHSAPAGPSLSEPGALEAAVAEAGLVVRESVDGRSSFDFPDRETMLRQMASAGGVVRIARVAGEGAVRSTLTEAMEPFRAPAGGYRLENDWHIVVATA
jgi:ubiquinone/menaquinone biosynthesis C-methylase UbiE